MSEPITVAYGRIIAAKDAEIAEWRREQDGLINRQVETDRTKNAEIAALREALGQIVKIGTRQHTVRIGDMYDLEGGYDDYEVVSDEAEFARAALEMSGGVL